MSEPQNRPGWWCPTCVEQVPPLHVTYEEKHYEEAGGCGGKVVPFPERERLRSAVIEAANELIDAHNAYWHTGLSEPTREIRQRWYEATFGVTNAARALQEHERKAGNT